MMTQSEFDRLKKDPSNHCVGNFLSVNHEANPRWLYYSDLEGNSVKHGGRGDSTDVRVHITPESRKKLKPRLVAYMEKLLARHNETLHHEGRKEFTSVMTIELPYKALKSSEYEVTLHTGSGVFYDQDEIAQEVMAVLSDLPIYKAIAPRRMNNFRRLDANNDGGPVRYYDPRRGVTLNFSIEEDASHLIIAKTDQKQREIFRELMYEYFTHYVKSTTKQDLVKVLGSNRLSAPVVDSQRLLEVAIEAGDAVPALSFSANIPFRGGGAFPRLAFARDVIECLHYGFDQIVSV
jgi:hypothetical protein